MKPLFTVVGTKEHDARAERFEAGLVALAAHWRAGTVTLDDVNGGRAASGDKSGPWTAEQAQMYFARVEERQRRRTGTPSLRLVQPVAEATEREGDVEGSRDG